VYTVAMLSAAFRSIILIGVFASWLLADDPFIGKWKLDLAKSKLTGQVIKIDEIPGNAYRFKEDEHSDIILADGLDQPTHFGDTMAIAQNGPGIWLITYRRGQRVLMNTRWEVSPDGQTLIYLATGTRPNGQRFANRMTAKRTGGGSGLAGTWETTGVTLSSPDEIDIKPYDSGGHTVSFPGRKQTVRMKFDGKEYREEGPTVAYGTTSSGRRIDERSIETTEKVKGKVIETAKATISEDGRTQTIVATEPDDETPVVLVYVRETGAVAAEKPGLASTPIGLSERAAITPTPAPLIKDKRAFGVLPNYRTAEQSAPFVAITTREKFGIAVKDSFDTPVYFTTAFFAGLSQAQGSDNSIYGQGLKGMAHRYGISYADQVAGNLFPEAIVPTLFHMDPRYFRNGEGSVKSRLGYAIGRIFVSQNDKGQTTFNSPEIIGNAMASIAGLAYHVHERTAGDVFNQFAFTYIAPDMVGQVLKEFWPDVKLKLFHKHPAATQ
jgi:hypothetical protein